MGTHIQLKPLGYICRRENSIAGSSSLMTQAGYSGEVERLEETEIQFHHEAILKKNNPQNFFQCFHKQVASSIHLKITPFTQVTFQ